MIGLAWSRDADTNVVSALVSMLNDPSMQMPVVIALGKLHRHPAIAVPGLMRAMVDGDGPTRLNAISALGQFGPDAAAAIPLLQDALRDRETSYRAGWALHKICPIRGSNRETP